MSRKKLFILAALCGMLLWPEALRACPSCYGAADGAMIQGMNMAILAMLGITGCVLAAISSFFLMMRRRIRQLRNECGTGTAGGNQPYVNEQGILQWNNF